MSGMTPERLRQKTRPMRTPEEVAISFTGECKPAAHGICANHKSPLGAAKTCLHVLHLTEVIHEREVEARADERAKVLDGFEWEERGEVGACTHPHHVHGVTGVPAWSSSECHHKFDADARHLVGPWEATK